LVGPAGARTLTGRLESTGRAGRRSAAARAAKRAVRPASGKRDKRSPAGGGLVASDPRQAWRQSLTRRRDLGKASASDRPERAEGPAAFEPEAPGEGWA